MGPNPLWLVSLYGEEIWTHKDTRDAGTQKKGHVRTQQEGAICKPRRETSGETSFTGTLRTEKINFCGLNHTLCGILLWQPKLLTKKTPFKSEVLQGDKVRMTPTSLDISLPTKMKNLHWFSGALAGGEEGENILGRRLAGANSSPALTVPESTPYKCTREAAFMGHMFKWGNAVSNQTQVWCLGPWGPSQLPSGGSLSLTIECCWCNTS